MAYILLNLQNAIKVMRCIVKEHTPNNNLSKLNGILSEIEIPLNKICDKITESKDVFGTYTCIVPLTRTEYTHLVNIYKLLLKIYHDLANDLSCKKHIEKLDVIIYNINIDVISMLEIILLKIEK